MADIELLTQLRQLLVKRFSDGELRTLCFDLGVEYEDLPGAGKTDKARELVDYMDRYDRLADLVRGGPGFATGCALAGGRPSTSPADLASSAARLQAQSPRSNAAPTSSRSTRPSTPN